ncbi:MAG: FliI/YscN family ATPase [Candidatus Brocadiae bacterium]|nr:FliI/YscN family ATPase [Candidatus Brocadiia bacterium]
MILDKLVLPFEKIQWTHWEGRVCRVSGLTVECTGIAPKVGEMCEVISQDNLHHVFCEVIGIEDRISILMPLSDTEGIGYGDRVLPYRKALCVYVGEYLQGSILDGYGNPISPLNLPKGKELPITNACPNPLERPPIKQVFVTGIKAIDSLLTCGRGQRIGIFAGSGVGKSTLLGSLARNSEADISVFALIGERGREVKSFMDDILGEKGLKKSVLVVATSDTSPLQRLKGVMTALTIAEFFRDLGKNVLFLCDSITRVAMAIREIGLARKEPPALRGYPPSLYGTLSKIVERLGNTPKGSITSFLTVLVEGEDFNEPVADTVRSLLDGHIVLRRELAEKGHYPPVSTLESVSRLMNELISQDHKKAAQKFRVLYHSYKSAQELINIGAYKAGSNPLIDEAIQRIQAINSFLCQTSEESFDFLKSLVKLKEAVGV